VSEFFNIEVVDELFVFAAIRQPGFDLPLNIEVEAEFYNIKVVELFVEAEQFVVSEFFNIKVDAEFYNIEVVD